MKVSVDYDELINELSTDVASGYLQLTDQIFIVRDEKALVDDYHPIIDWYHEHDFSDDNVNNDIADESDRLRAVKKTVSDVLEEMNERNSIF